MTSGIRGRLTLPASVRECGRGRERSWALPSHCHSRPWPRGRRRGCAPLPANSGHRVCWRLIPAMPTVIADRAAMPCPTTVLLHLGDLHTTLGLRNAPALPPSKAFGRDRQPGRHPAASNGARLPCTDFVPGAIRQGCWPSPLAARRCALKVFAERLAEQADLPSRRRAERLRQQRRGHLRPVLFCARHHARPLHRIRDAIGRCAGCRQGRGCSNWPTQRYPRERASSPSARARSGSKPGPARRTPLGRAALADEIAECGAGSWPRPRRPSSPARSCASTGAAQASPAFSTRPAWIERARFWSDMPVSSASAFHRRTTVVDVVQSVVEDARHLPVFRPRGVSGVSVIKRYSRGRSASCQATSWIGRRCNELAQVRHVLDHRGARAR